MNGLNLVLKILQEKLLAKRCREGGQSDQVDTALYHLIELATEQDQRLERLEGLVRRLESHVRPEDTADPAHMKDPSQQEVSKTWQSAQ